VVVNDEFPRAPCLARPAECRVGGKELGSASKPFVEFNRGRWVRCLDKAVNLSAIP
jgi:hypothetical protein